MNHRLSEARAINDKAYQRQLQHFRSQALQIIDDVRRIGSRTDGFCEILHERHAQKKSTILTTNFGIAEWECV